MADFKTKFLTKYNASMNKLHSVGDEYIGNAQDNEKAQDNLFKVYKGYAIASVVLAYSILILSLGVSLLTKNYTWLFIMPLAYILPKSLQWSMRNVLNIDDKAYYDWSQKNKQK